MRSYNGGMETTKEKTCKTGMVKWSIDNTWALYTFCMAEVFHHLLLKEVSSHCGPEYGILSPLMVLISWILDLCEQK